MTVSDYLLLRLQELGIGHVFGIPGDFILPFYLRLEASELMHVGACNELGAAYAADGYARMTGIGALAVTYGPGAFSAVNAVAGAFAERVPLVVIAGGPTASAYQAQPNLHHVLPGNYAASQAIFSQITEVAVVITDSHKATEQIDQALVRCYRSKRPVYIELASDIQTAECGLPDGALSMPDQAVGNNTDSVVSRIIAALDTSEQPCLLPGHEIHSFGLQSEVTELVNSAQIPSASMFVGKADYLEQSRWCMGTYQGAPTPDKVRDYVESSDVRLCLGTIDSDFNLGGFTADFSHGETFWICNDQFKSRDEVFDGVDLCTVVGALSKHYAESPRKNSREVPVRWYYPTGKNVTVDPEEAITDQYVYDRLSSFLRPEDIVVADGGGLINTPYIQMPTGARWLGSGFWASIGAGFGFAMGARMSAGDDARVIAVAGDGSFQMTAQELSTFSRYKKSIIVFVLNNRGYTAERVIHDGSFNDVADWRYSELCAAFGGTSLEVRTCGEFDSALEHADAYREPAPLLVEIHLDPMDASDVFKRLAATLKK